MNFLAFLFFSTLEYLGFIFFILALFRFSIREHIVKFVIFSVILSFVSNSMQLESLQAISSLLQAFLMICFVAFLLRVHIFNSLIMVITGYVINFIVQWILIAVVIHFTGSDEVITGTPKAYITQTASAFIMFSFGVITLFLKGGFSFIDHDTRSRRSKIFTKENRPLIILVSISIIMTFLANLLMYSVKDTPYLLVASILFVALIGLIYMCVKKDERTNG